MNVYLYILFYLAMLGLSIVAFKVDDKKRKIIFVLMCISFYLFYGFRDEGVGFDTGTYLYRYTAKNPRDYEMMETAFYLFSKLCWSLHLPGRVYISLLTLTVVVLCGVAYFLTFEEKTEYLCISYLCMFCLPYTIMMNVNVVRQGMAVSALILASILLDRGHRKKAFIIAIMGCMFHYMCIALLLGVCVSYLVRDTKRLVIPSVILCFLGTIIGITGIGYKVLLLFPENQITARVLCYLDKPVEGSALVKIAFYLGVSLVVIVLLSKRMVETNCLCRLMLVVFVLTGLGVSCMNVSERFAISLDLMIPLLFLNPTLLERVEGMGGKKYRRLYVGGYFIFSLAMFLFGIVSNPVKANLRF